MERQKIIFYVFYDLFSFIIYLYWHLQLSFVDRSFSARETSIYLATSTWPL